jgi:hypothetical protein
MKKLVVLGLLTLFIISCGQSATRSEYWQHDSMYKNNSHMWFSWFGHRNVNSEDVQKSQEQGWWGTEVPYVPGQ